MGIGAIAQVYKAVLNPELGLPNDYLGNSKHVDDSSSSSSGNSRAIVPSTEDGTPNVSGSIVAIKVLHPGVEKMISRDLKIMMAFGKFSSFLFSFSISSSYSRYSSFSLSSYNIERIPRNGMVIIPRRSNSIRRNDDVSIRFTYRSQ